MGILCGERVSRSSSLALRRCQSRSSFSVVIFRRYVQLASTCKKEAKLLVSDTLLETQLGDVRISSGAQYHVRFLICLGACMGNPKSKLMFATHAVSESTCAVLDSAWFVYRSPKNVFLFRHMHAQYLKASSASMPVLVLRLIFVVSFPD